VRIRDSYARYDAEREFSIPNLEIADPQACQCGDVLRGVLKPWQCRMFGTGCRPETPLGALMVSSEGACAAYYQFRGVRRQSSVSADIQPEPVR
jgi:hydrogenase expression/formation protein HypD